VGEEWEYLIPSRPIKGWSERKKNLKKGGTPGTNRCDYLPIKGKGFKGA